MIPSIVSRWATSNHPIKKKGDAKQNYRCNANVLDIFWFEEGPKSYPQITVI